MLMTEEEARGKWCPFVRVLAIADFASAAGVNRGATSESIPAGSTCLASACACWAWSEVRPPVASVGIHQELRRGSCGLAREGIG